MKIALFGARGTIGSRIAAEARRRGQTVTAVVRDRSGLPSGLAGVRGDALDPTSVARAVAGHDALKVYRHADLDWTYISPAALIAPGERTGHYRVGFDQLLVDARGESHISAEDFAVAVVDEIEHPRHVRQRITVAY